MTPPKNQDEKSLKSLTQNKNLNKKTDANINKFRDFKFIGKAMEASTYYGFSPIKTPALEKIDYDRAREITGEKFVNKNNTFSQSARISLEEKNALLRYYTEKKFINEHQPMMLSYENINFSKKNDAEYDFLNLQMIGASKSMSEIVLIKTAVTLLSDKGIKNIYININSIGDKDSTNKFVKELNAYYRKNINKMSSYCRQLFKKDPFLLLENNKECCVDLNDEAPKALSFLSEPSRQHFKEVLEGLEILDIPYRINNKLLSDRCHSSQTVFEIIAGNDNNKKVIASGERYDGLAKKIGFKKDIPAVGIKISSKNLLTGSFPRSKIKPPNFFFLQLGFDAKLKGLNVIETLRKSKILVYQSLNRDMMGGQIVLAEKMKIPYILIMGKKESIENTVIVRDMNTRSQEIVPINNLSMRLKKLKI